MQPLSVRRLAGVLLIIVPLSFTVCFTLLQQLFEYSDILRQPTADILAKFVAGGTPLVAVRYVLTLTAAPLGWRSSRSLASPRPRRPRRPTPACGVATAFASHRPASSQIAWLLALCPSWCRTRRSPICRIAGSR